MNQEKAPLDYQKFVSNIASTIAQQFRSGDARPEPESVAAAAVPAVAAPAAAERASAVPPVESYCLDHEKIVWHFPDTAARLIEEVP